MKTKMLLLALIFAGFSCKKDVPDSIPQVINGSWWLNGISILSTLKSAPQFNSESRDTAIHLVFSPDHTLQYLEVSWEYDANNRAVIVDTFYHCTSTYSISGNKLTMPNITPKYKPYFSVKDYTFLVHKSYQDTILTIQYEETVGNLLKTYGLDFDKTTY